MLKTLLCTQCGYIGTPVKQNKGSALIEVILWLCMILPGVLYSVWRRSSLLTVCPQCKSSSMIPLDSPRARKFLEDQGQNHEEYLVIAREENKKIENTERNRKILYGILFGSIVLLIIFFGQIGTN